MVFNCLIDSSGFGESFCGCRYGFSSYEDGFWKWGFLSCRFPRIGAVIAFHIGLVFLLVICHNKQAILVNEYWLMIRQPLDFVFVASTRRHITNMLLLSNFNFIVFRPLVQQQTIVVDCMNKWVKRWHCTETSLGFFSALLIYLSTVLEVSGTSIPTVNVGVHLPSTHILYIHLQTLHIRATVLCKNNAYCVSH